MQKFALLLCLAIGLLAAAPSQAAGPVNDGQWQITTEVDMPGMPMKMPPMTFTQCITQKDMVPQNPQQQNTNCKMEKNEVKGDTVTWKMVCNQPEGVMTMTGRITYKGDSFEGESKTSMPAQQGMGMEMSSRMTGKRLGPCK